MLMHLCADQSLWITDSMEFGAGAGGDWGQRLSEQEFIAGLEKDNIETVLHELGHTFALDGKFFPCRSWRTC